MTGHYARVITNEDGNRELHRAADWAKDQSYVLGVLTHEQPGARLVPLADTPSKAQVRAEAAERGFSVAKKPDSYDICFIPEGDTRAWLGEHIQMRPGLIKDTSGQVLGEHPGAQAYTVGQRRGLALGRPAPDGKPRFVLEVRPPGERGDRRLPRASGRGRDSRHPRYLGRSAGGTGGPVLAGTGATGRSQRGVRGDRSGTCPR